MVEISDQLEEGSEPRRWPFVAPWPDPSLRDRQRLAAELRDARETHRAPRLTDSRPLERPNHLHPNRHGYTVDAETGELCRRPRGDRRVPIRRCRKCGGGIYTGRSRQCNRRRCPGYIDVWLGDCRMRVLENLVAARGDVAMFEITPPGAAAGYGFDPAECIETAPHRCSGLLGCKVNAEQAHWWNSTADTRYSELHRIAADRVRKRHGAGQLRRIIYVPELQRRGLIHWHVVLAFATPRERRAAEDYVREVNALAARFDYGFVNTGRRGRGGVRRLEVANPVRAAHYLSKYLTKETASGLRELVVQSQAPARAVYVSRECTALTRCTMRNLRLRRVIWCMWRVRLDCPEVEAAWQLIATFEGSVIDITDEPADAHAPPAPHAAAS